MMHLGTDWKMTFCLADVEYKIHPFKCFTELIEDALELELCASTICLLQLGYDKLEASYTRLELTATC